MSASSSPNAIHTDEDGVRKTLDVTAIRQGRFASVSLTFDGRYRRSIQLNRQQLIAHSNACKDLADQLLQES